jgi:hypothetical protein
MALNPVSYTRIDQPDTGENFGFIAQQVGGVFPALVSTTSPTALTPGGTLTLNYVGLIAPIVKAVQDIASVSGVFKDNLVAWLGNSGNGIANLFAQTIIATNVKADTVTTKTLCLDDLCITKTQLQNLLNGSGAQPASATAAASSTSVQAPVISVIGNNPAQVNVGDSYIDLGAQVTGPQEDLNLGIKASVDGGPELTTATIDTAVAGIHTITYRSTDQAGNVGTAIRTVIVGTVTATSTPVTATTTTAISSSTSAPAPSISSTATSTHTTIAPAPTTSATSTTPVMIDTTTPGATTTAQ